MEKLAETSHFDKEIIKLLFVPHLLTQLIKKSLVTNGDLPEQTMNKEKHVKNFLPVYKTGNTSFGTEKTRFFEFPRPPKSGKCP